MPGAGNQILEDVAIYSEDSRETLRQQVQYNLLVQFLYGMIRNLPDKFWSVRPQGFFDAAFDPGIFDPS